MSEASLPLDPRIAAGVAPLPEDAPDPAAFRYEAEFEALDGAIRQAEREGPASVDWRKVAADAQAIIANRSKDLLVAAWFAHAAMRAEGLPGLAAGLGLMAAMVEAHWDRLFPPKTRERARIQAVEWLAARTAPLVPESLPTGQAPATLAALEAADRLQDLLDARLTAPASLSDLSRPLRRLAEEARRAAAAEAAAKPAAETTAAPPPPSPPPQTPPPPPAPPRPAAPAATAIAIPDQASPEQTLSALREGIRAAALRILETDPREARAYALLRAITWLGLTELPPAVGGRTQLLPPPATRLTEFDAMRSAGNWAELSLSLEKFLSGSGMFWLDGQRLAHQALLAMGPDYAAAAREVARGTALALERLPGLPTLAFQDGTPFADSATQAWIEREATLNRAPAEAGGGEAAPWAAALAQARGLAGEGKAEEGVALLATGTAAAAGGRARLQWRLATGRFLLEVGQPGVALPLAQSAMEAARALSEWEPEAAAEAARLLHACLGTRAAAELLGPEALAEARRQALRELATLDPLSAVRLGAGKTA